MSSRSEAEAPKRHEDMDINAFLTDARESVVGQQQMQQQRWNYDRQVFRDGAEYSRGAPRPRPPPWDSGRISVPPPRGPPSFAPPPRSPRAPVVVRRDEAPRVPVVVRRDEPPRSPAVARRDEPERGPVVVRRDEPERGPVVVRRDEPPPRSSAPVVISRPPEELQKRPSAETVDEEARPKVARQDSGLGSEDDEDADHERRHRDKIRTVQNEGTEAYLNKDYATARDCFERALRDHATHLEMPTPSGVAPPSRVLADRDALKCKLLKYLARSLEKLHDDDAAHARADEAVAIEQRLADYQKRKKEHKRSLHRRPP
ncbi:hypothetical protein CTAYLR_002650 [Chrysophaeum taylorii]|uniref:Uncharacterized protein n=1 Tax=Chrysophaeum taylorii TaxID=2483200 RepID=A0AAD7XJP5_9STRA|nr:hypothetical protein CTAYLR_002650 [Chrysophaeum taylorii]